MARQTVKTTTRKGRRRKSGGGSEYVTCNIYHGTGKVRRKSGKKR